MRLQTGFAERKATISAMKPSESSPALSESELSRLDDLLAAAEPDDAMMLEEYDGFCAALACAPSQVPADECLPVILGVEPGPALRRLSDSDRGTLLELLGQHRRAVARRLKEGESWNAVIGTDESGRALGDAWAIGFLRAVSLRPDDWAIADNDEVCEEALELMLRFAGEAADTEDDEAPEPIDDDEREELVDMMLDGVAEIYTRLAPAREQSRKH
jgi:uncharacterized protein